MPGRHDRFAKESPYGHNEIHPLLHRLPIAAGHRPWRGNTASRSTELHPRHAGDWRAVLVHTGGTVAGERQTHRGTGVADHEVRDLAAACVWCCEGECDGGESGVQDLDRDRQQGAGASGGAGHAVHSLFDLAYPLTTHGSAGQFQPAERDLEYREVYDFACHLLRTYNGTGKSFYLGHWEGDWHLRPQFDPKQPFPEHYAEHFIAWLRVRQQAIDDAKRDTPHAKVWLWHYTEVNLVQPFLKGGQCLTHDILPQVDVDYVSYSCYDSLQGKIHEDLTAALDHIESYLKPRPGLPPGKRVFIGEYGFPARRFTPEQQNTKSIETMVTALQWGCPFALYWELYDNEGTPEKPGGFWLINEKNEKQPVWDTHRRFYQWARKYLAEVTAKTGASPSLEEFRQEAVRELERR